MQPGFNVPILGQRSTAPTQYACASGHKFAGMQPQMLLMTNLTDQRGQPMSLLVQGACPWCVKDFLEAAFPAEEVTEIAP